MHNMQQTRVSSPIFFNAPWHIITMRAGWERRLHCNGFTSASLVYIVYACYASTYVGTFYINDMPLNQHWNTAPLTSDQDFFWGGGGGQTCNCFLAPKDSNGPTLHLTTTHLKTNSDWRKGICKIQQRGQWTEKWQPSRSETSKDSLCQV